MYLFLGWYFVVVSASPRSSVSVAVGELQRVAVSGPAAATAACSHAAWQRYLRVEEGSDMVTMVTDMVTIVT